MCLPDEQPVEEGGGNQCDDTPIQPTTENCSSGWGWLVVLQAISNAGRNCITQERSKCSTVIADTLDVHGRPVDVYVGDSAAATVFGCGRQLSFSRVVRKAQSWKLMRTVFTVPVTVGCDARYIGAGPGRLHLNACGCERIESIPGANR